MRASSLAAGLTAVLLPLSVGCSSSDDVARDGDTTSGTSTTTAPTTTPPPTTPTTPVTSSDLETTTPSDGDWLSGTGYSVAIPDGWVDITADLQSDSPTVELAMGEASATGFRTNLNVVNGGTATGTIEDAGPEIRREAARELMSLTKTVVTPLPDRSIDGEAALGQTSSFVSSGKAVTFVQYYVVHAGTVFPVTLTFAPDQRAEAQRALDQVLVSWRWDG